jgi:hypothetical protein
MNLTQGLLYCPTAYRSISAGEDFQLLHVLLQNRTVLLPTDSLRVLSACRAFRTIPGHISKVSELLSPGHQKVAEEHIHHLIKMDLLLPCLNAIPSGTRGSKTNISTLGIITADREQECSRAFLSYTNHLRRYSRKTTVTVFDDSRNPTSLRDRLEGLSKTFSGTIRYAGYTEKEVYVDALSKAGIDAEIARFAIVGRIHPDICSIGANRNAFLLDTVGESVFSVDDDTVCTLRPHPDRVQGLRFECLRNPRDTWFYQERSDLLAEDGWGEYDLLAEHEELLGESAAHLAHSRGVEHLEGNNVCGDLLYALQSGCGRVLVTMSGIAGDSGSFSSKWILGMRDDSRQRLEADEKRFRIALRSREILGVVKSPTVDPSSFCIATTIALANEHALPPFLPIGRNEDGVFGTLLNMAIPHALLGHIPLAVLHDARLGREYVQFPEFRLADLVLSLVERFNPGGSATIAGLLRGLGQRLIESSSLPTTELNDLISESVLMREARKIKRTSIIAKTDEVSKHFQEETAQYRHQLIQNVTSGPPIVPMELRNAFGRDAYVKMREFLNLVGRVFYYWPDIVEAARHLRNTGQQVSKAIKS